MGYVEKSGKRECKYWVRLLCKSLGDASEKEVQKLNCYSLEHNKRAQTIRQAVIVNINVE